uniref:Secretion-regulating guanine nucleotide exchange factor n=1 Tax=Davidia involucrata TaxID=16924 RepID=A0A5B7BRJ6_DAVIN
MFRRGNKSLKPWNGSRKLQVPVLIIFLILILVTLIMLFHDNGKKPSSSIGLIKQKWNSFESLPQFNPTMVFRNGTDMIWQIPDSPKAVLFLAHGCNGRAVNFWDRSPKCLNCVGLPEERLIVLHALAQKFAVLTISSAGRCWSFGKERLIVKEIINWWVEKYKLEKLPLVALGASSGGYFVSVLANDLRFSSITIMIAEGMFDQMDITKRYPPTLFVHMPKDEARKHKIDEKLEVLREKGIDVAEIKCMEFPLSPSFLSDRIPGLDQTISVKLFDLFQNNGFIDKNGYMRNDGRAIRWKAALKERELLLPDKNLVHHIQEELNLAFAYHEMTSLQSEQIFDWFESHMS